MNTKKTMPEIKTINGKKQAKIPKSRKQLLSNPYIISEIYTPGCISHAATLQPDHIGQNSSLIVQDFFVDSSGLSKGGESVNPLIQIGLNAPKTVTFSIIPEACKKGFKVSKPTGISKGYFVITFGRSALHWAIGGSGFFDVIPASITFNNLSGITPAITYSNFFISNGANNAFYVYITGEFSKNFSFTDIEIKCDYPTRNFLPQFDFYKLLSFSTPLTIPSTTDIFYTFFGYESPTQVDLGSIIKLL